MSYFLRRLREPSSLAGIGALLALVGIEIAPEQWQAIVNLIAAGAAAAAVFLPDRR